MKIFGVTGLILLSLAIRVNTSAGFAGQPEPEQLFTAVTATRYNTLTGFTRARATMQLTSQLPDQLTEIRSDIGDQIDNDGVFARLNTTYVQLDLEKIAINKAKLISRIAYLDKESSRFQTLFARQSASEAKLDSLIQDLAQARLALDSMLNEERRLQEHLRRHTITAPPGWLVITRNVEPGEWVGAGTPLAKIGDYHTLLVPISVNQEEYNWIKQRADALILRLPDHDITVKARLHNISPGFDQQTRKLNLQLAITAEMPEKRGGIRAELTTSLPDPAGALLVPRSAVSTRYDSYWLTRADGEQVKVIVLGQGLEPGTLRVTGADIKAGNEFLRAPDSQPPVRE